MTELEKQKCHKLMWEGIRNGKEAQDIADSGLSLEEYYGFTGGDYVDK